MEELLHQELTRRLGADARECVVMIDHGWRSAGKAQQHGGKNTGAIFAGYIGNRLPQREH